MYLITQANVDAIRKEFNSMGDITGKERENGDNLVVSRLFRTFDLGLYPSE